MTRDEILTMKPGRELDALVAETMGTAKYAAVSVIARENSDGTHPEHTIFKPDDYEGCLAKCHEWNERKGFSDSEAFRPVAYSPRHYSTDIAAAWEVREALCESGGVELLNMCEEHPQCCVFTTCALGSPLDMFQVISVMADTMPEAICKVALLAELDDLSPFDIEAETCQGWLSVEEADKP